VHRGHATVVGGVIADVGAVAVAIPARNAPRPLIVSIGGLGSRITAHETELVRTLKRFCSR
jgi:DNA-binding IclR family transcriptional regulator